MIAVVIKVSEEQSDHLNRGADFVHQFGVTWILTQYEVFISRLPEAGEKVLVSTQAVSYNKFFCYRNFWIETEEGEELVRVESIFALMNYTTRKISSVTEEIIAPYESEKIMKIKRIPKVPVLEQAQSVPFRVRFYDIDSNHHVNNSVYFNWIIECLDYDFLTTYEPTYINIRFDKEVEYGSQVDSHFEVMQTEDQVKSLHAIKIGAVKYCEAQIDWKRR